MNTPKPDGPGKLIGGYATNNLSDREKEQLFQAALEDQELFNALMEDESLRHLLEQPGVRDELIESLTPKQTVWQRVRRWLGTPVAWGSIGAVATAAVVLTVVVNTTPPRNAAVQVAKVEPKLELPKPERTVTPSQVEMPAQRVSERAPAVTNEAGAAARRRQDVAADSVAPVPAAAPPPAVVGGLQKDKEARQERDQAVNQSQSQSQSQSQQAQIQAQAAAPQALAVQVSPAPSPEAKKQEAAAGAVLAFDYTVLPNGVEIVPSVDGFAAILTRTAAGSSVVSSSRARRGVATILRFPANAAGSTYQLVLTRDATTAQGFGGPAAEEATSSFRAAVPRAKRAAIAAPAAPPGQAGGRAATGEALSDKAANGTVSGHAAAESPAATRIVVEITVPRR